MSPTPKHLRPRWRYLAVGIETWPDTHLDRTTVQAALWEAARELIGDSGSASVDLAIFRFSFSEGRGHLVVRTYRDSVGMARAAIACVTKVDHVPVRVHVRGVSGTVRGCEEKYLGRDQERIGETTVTVDGVDRTGFRRGTVIDFRSDATFVGATTLDFQ